MEPVYNNIKASKASAILGPMQHAPSSLIGPPIKRHPNTEQRSRNPRNNNLSPIRKSRRPKNHPIKKKVPKITSDSANTTWEGEYQRVNTELEEFSSSVVQVETKLNHAKVYTSNLSKPNELETVVACECLDELIPHTKYWRPSLILIREMLHDAIFSNKTLGGYMDRTTFFAEVALNRSEKAKGRRHGIAHGSEQEMLLDRLKQLSVEDLQNLLFKLLSTMTPENLGWILASEDGADKWHAAILEPLCSEDRLQVITTYASLKLTRTERQALVTELEMIQSIYGGDGIAATNKRRSLMKSISDDEKRLNFLKLLTDSHKDSYAAIVSDASSKELKNDQALDVALELLQNNKPFWNSINTLLENVGTKPQRADRRLGENIRRSSSSSASSQETSSQRKYSIQKPARRSSSVLGRLPEVSQALTTPLEEDDTSSTAQKQSVNDAGCQTEELSSTKLNEGEATILDKFIAALVVDENATNHASSDTVNLPAAAVLNADKDTMSASKAIAHGERQLRAKGLLDVAAKHHIKSDTNRISELYSIILEQQAALDRMKGATTNTTEDSTIEAHTINPQKQQPQRKPTHAKKRFLKAQKKLQLFSALTSSSSAHSPNGSGGSMMKRSECLDLIMSIYHSKMVRDDHDDRVYRVRQAFADHIKASFHKKFGLLAIAESQYQSFEAAIVRWHKVDNRMRLFGWVSGIVAPPKGKMRFDNSADFLLLAFLHLFKSINNLEEKMKAFWSSNSSSGGGGTADTNTAGGHAISYPEAVLLVSELFKATLTGKGDLLAQLNQQQGKTAALSIDWLLEAAVRRRFEQQQDEESAKDALFRAYETQDSIVPLEGWIDYMQTSFPELETERLHTIWRKNFNEASGITKAEFLSFVDLHLRHQSLQYLKAHHHH